MRATVPGSTNGVLMIDLIDTTDNAAIFVKAALDRGFEPVAFQPIGDTGFRVRIDTDDESFAADALLKLLEIVALVEGKTVEHLVERRRRAHAQA